MRNGFELAQFEFEKITLRSWRRIFQFRYDAGSFHVQIVVNVGDMLQRLTNNKLRSTTHRVVNPPREMWGTSRFSIPFFLHPKSNMSLACLPGCIDAKHPKAYPDATAGEYLDERLREIGLKK